MSETMVGIIGVLAMLVAFMTGLEVSFAMTLVGLIGFSYLISTKAAFAMVAQDIFGNFSSYGYSVLPIFILMGQAAFNGGIAKRLYDSAYKFVGHIPGGLAMATVVASGALGSVVGSANATTATFASIAVPEMDRYGYNRRLSAGVVASAGTLGCVVPPSVVLIVYGIITEQSIGKLFLATIFPGLIIGSCFMAIIYSWCKINPSLGPRGERSSWNKRMRSAKDVGWVLAIFLVVMGGMMRGLFTPTEAASVGCSAVCILGFLKMDLNLKSFWNSLTEALVMACMVIMLLIGSTIFGHFIAATKIPLVVADWIADLPLNRYTVLILIGFIYLLGGSCMDDMAFMILATPILYPVVLKLGFDLVWFGMFLHITLMIGVIIPPIAVLVFVVNKITMVPIWDIYRGVLPFLLSLVLTIFLLILFPQLALFLPSFFAR